MLRGEELWEGRKVLGRAGGCALGRDEDDAGEVHDLALLGGGRREAAVVVPHEEVLGRVLGGELEDDHAAALQPAGVADEPDALDAGGLLVARGERRP